MPDPNNPGSFINIDCKSGMPSGNTIIKTEFQKFVEWIKNNKLKTLAIVLSIVLSVWMFVKWLANNDNKIPKSGTDTITLTELLGEYAPYIAI